MKKNISLILGISIPVLMVVAVALSIYLPALFAKQPQYNFLYAVNGNYSYGTQYSVQGRKLVKTDVHYPTPKGEPVAVPVPPLPNDQKLFLYDVKADTSHGISFDDAAKLSLSADQKSPDGFEVSYGNNRDGGVFPFFFGGGGDYNTLYLRGSGLTRKLNVDSNTFYYNFRLLGWVMN